MKKILIILFCLIIFSILLFTTGFPFSFYNKGIDIKTYCSEKQHYWLGQCSNGDYLTGDDRVYDLQGRYLMHYGSFGKRMSIRGWWNEKFLKREVGCAFGNAKLVCDGPVPIY